jgi:transposase
MLHVSAFCKYYLYNGKADMRKGFDSLSGIVSSQMHCDLLSGAVFIFLNKKRNQVKLLLWEGDGLALYHKRLEKGTYELPLLKAETATLSITSEQLLWILQGISLKSVHKRKRYQHLGENC